MPSDQSRILAKIDRISGNLFGLGTGAEKVAHSADRVDQRAVPAELLPEVADMHVEDAIEGRGPAAVEGGGQLVARDDPAGGVDQELQDIVLDRRDGTAAPSQTTSRAWGSA